MWPQDSGKTKGTLCRWSIRFNNSVVKWQTNRLFWCRYICNTRFRVFVVLSSIFDMTVVTTLIHFGYDGVDDNDDSFDVASD
jgi:hypothetical protein